MNLKKYCGVSHLIILPIKYDKKPWDPTNYKIQYIHKKVASSLPDKPAGCQ